ncbi:WhiB family transcriptional regulator [Kitasatospora mediocidica]|uniref:WhiB family transcriptional regulator n=1 Tax=Kitasatospora mediocidica TaxID=58352 RepID=UPI00068D11AC|nr:WhiB family transcriptional regulator [Kitasatospora mediocidica]
MSARNDEQPWWLSSTCRTVDPELFFPARYNTPTGVTQAAQAVGICRYSCPVRTQCLTEALEAERGTVGRNGILGGHTPAERLAIDNGKQTSDLPAEHGTRQAWLFGCRCDDCAVIDAEQQKTDLHRMLAAVPAGTAHGSYAAYRRYGCRCEPCKGAAAAETWKAGNRRKVAA